MKTLPKISIVTPTFNAARYLAQAIESIAIQRYPHVEYIVVDGGSTDDTLDIVKAHEGLVTRWISEPDDGISDAFNKGISMATGEIIGIINADDYYHPGAFDAVAASAEETPEADVYFGDAIHERFDGSGMFHFKPALPIGKFIWRRMPISHPATFVRRSAYEKYGLYDTRYRLAMDYDLILRMYRRGAKFCYVPSTLAHFRYGQDRGMDGLREVRESAIGNGLPRVLAHSSYFLGIFKLKMKESLFNSRHRIRA